MDQIISLKLPPASPSNWRGDHPDSLPLSTPLSEGLRCYAKLSFRHTRSQEVLCWWYTINRLTPMLAWVVSGRLPYQRHSTSAVKYNIALRDAMTSTLILCQNEECSEIFSSFSNKVFCNELEIPSTKRKVKASQRALSQSEHTPAWALAARQPWAPPPQVGSLVPLRGMGPPSCVHTRQNGAKVNDASNVNTTSP